MTLRISVLSHDLPGSRAPATINDVVGESSVVSGNGHARTCAQARVASAPEPAGHSCISVYPPLRALPGQRVRRSVVRFLLPGSNPLIKRNLQGFLCNQRPALEDLTGSRLTSVKGML
jgi:hypothetical protein